jgi:hypothetical protein
LKMCIQVTMADPKDQLVPRCSRSRTRGLTLISKLGLDPKMLEALPQVQYKDLPVDELEQKHFDCTVCLSIFNTNKSLRYMVPIAQYLPSLSHMSNTSY